MNKTHTFATPKGTTLPLMQLQGNDYLQVAYRLVWFREEHPTDWSIETEYTLLTADTAICKATVKDATGRILQTAHKQEYKKSFGDYIEKAETGAEGRALAALGYGTQFAITDLDEGERIVDSPVARPKADPKRVAAIKALETVIAARSDLNAFNIRDLAAKHFPSAKNRDDLNTLELETFAQIIKNHTSDETQIPKTKQEKPK